MLFLRKLKRGGSEHSFGIHVARMAGMPGSVVKRAGEVLSEMEGAISSEDAKKKGDSKSKLAKPVAGLATNREGMQLSIYQLDDPVLKQIRDEIIDLDVNNLTPVDSINKLYNIQKLIRK